MEKIILASASPRRRQLLEWAEVPFEVMVRETDESYPASSPVEEIPVYIARNKALAVQKEAGREKTILAADTVVVLGDWVIGKPQSREDAIRILSDLSGRQHRVITGVALLHPSGETAFADSTTVTFHPLTPQQIAFYVDRYKPYDKAGAYAIQEWIGVVGIQSITGDFYNVMGLPVSRVIKALNDIFAG